MLLQNNKKDYVATKIGLALFLFGFIYMRVAKLERDACTKMRSFCVIDKKSRGFSGATYLTYSHWLSGRRISISVNTSIADSIYNKINIGDTLVMEYCLEKPNLFTDPMYKDIYLISTLR
ncbi:MAG: hypothetical protein RL660_2506 [Bacteroidota bacterium]|jgi:hypothetical protein